MATEMDIRIVQLEPKYFDRLAALQRACYPTLGEQELMRVEHLESQHRVFPEGQFVAIAGDEPVGMASGFFTDFDFDNPRHTFAEVSAGLYFTTHDPEGDYYYGADISVHPRARKRGIGRRLYRARQALVRRTRRKGIVAGGLIPGYARHKHEMSAREYVDRVVAGELRDPTLSFQLRNGFIVRGVIQNYIQDEASDNWATLILWPNPDRGDATPDARGSAATGAAGPAEPLGAGGVGAA